MEPMDGVIDTSAPGATASVEVFGLPPGRGYLVALEAVTVDREIACRGDAFFDVDAGASTEVMVMLNCKPPERFGGVRVNGEFNVCPELTKVVVSPLQTSLGNDITLSATAFDPEGDPDPLLLVRQRRWQHRRPDRAVDHVYVRTRRCEQNIRVFINDDVVLGASTRGASRSTASQAIPRDLMCLPSQSLCRDAQIDPTRPLLRPRRSFATRTRAPATKAPSTPRAALRPEPHFTHRLNAMRARAFVQPRLRPRRLPRPELPQWRARSGGWRCDGVDNAFTGLGPVLVGRRSQSRPCSTKPSRIAYAVRSRPPQGQALRDVHRADRRRFSSWIQTSTKAAPTSRSSPMAAASDRQSSISGRQPRRGTYCASGELGTIPFDILGDVCGARQHGRADDDVGRGVLRTA